MTKKEMTVGKTTFKYNINDFRDWLIEKGTFALNNGKPDTIVGYSLVALNEFEKECKNGK